MIWSIAFVPFNGTQHSVWLFVNTHQLLVEYKNEKEGSACQGLFILDYILFQYAGDNSSLSLLTLGRGPFLFTGLWVCSVL